MARRFATALALSLLALTLLATAAGARSLRSLIAPVSACSNQNDVGFSVAEQERAMRCMTNFARAKVGLPSLGDAAELDRSAAAKASDIVRCDSFSHEACGRGFTYWIGRVGYLRARCWRAGENLAWGTGRAGDVRAIFSAWIHSPEHRKNILGRYGQIGIGLTVGRLDDSASAHVWTQHFGSHCGVSKRPRGVARLAPARALG